MATEIDQTMLAVQGAPVEYKCVVCKGKRQGNFLRIEVCRACAVFFRRANTHGTVLKCRSGTDDCKLDRDSVWSCKKCRYNRLRHIYDQVMLQETHNEPGPSNSLEWNYGPVPEKEIVSYHLDELDPMNVSPMLLKFRRCYNDLCRERLIVDFGSLDLVPFNENGIIESEASNVSYNSPSAIMRLYDQISNFLSAASEEYAVMVPEYKMKLFANFVRIWIPFECSYRSMKYFSQYLASFGHYIDIFNIARYHEEIPDNIFKKDALRMMQEVAINNYALGKRAVTRINLSDEEYIGITVLLLWNIILKSVPDALAEVARKNKTAVLHDLYKYYRSIGLVDYSARLGEVFMLLHLFEKLIDSSSRLHEVFKVFGIMDDEMY